MPSTEWPAYRHGKYFFRSCGEESSDLQVGLYIEKGLAPEIQEAYPSAKGSRYIMDDSWLWHSLREPSAMRSLSECVGAAIEEADPLHLSISGGYVPDPGSFDPRSTSFPWDRVRFRCLDSSLIKLEETEHSAGALKTLDTVGSWSELQRALTMLHTNGWLWINFFLYRVYRTRGEQGLPDAEHVWRDHLQHFRPWVRAG